MDTVNNLYRVELFQDGTTNRYMVAARERRFVLAILDAWLSDQHISFPEDAPVHLYYEGVCYRADGVVASRTLEERY